MREGPGSGHASVVSNTPPDQFAIILASPWPPERLPNNRLVGTVAWFLTLRTPEVPMAAPTAPRTPTERRNRDAEVVAAGIRVFHTKGFSAATMQDIADEVGVLKGSLYHYISSKEELLYRILTESHEQAAAIMAEVSALEVTPIERLRTYLHRMHLWYLTNHERASLYYNQQRNLTGKNLDQVRAQARGFEQYLRELLAEARGSGALRPDLDIRLATLFLLGALNSLPRWYTPGGGYEPDQVATAFTDLAVRSLLAESEAATPKRVRTRQA